MSRFKREAERESFREVPETCPTVDEILRVAESGIKDCTTALRNALNAALERALQAEERVEELENLVDELKTELADARSIA